MHDMDPFHEEQEKTNRQENLNVPKDSDYPFLRMMDIAPRAVVKMNLHLLSLQLLLAKSGLFWTKSRRIDTRKKMKIYGIWVVCTIALQCTCIPK